MAFNEADDSATLVNASGRPVRNFSYEEIRRLIGKSGTTRELNKFVSVFSFFFFCPFLSCEFHNDGYYDYSMLFHVR